ncbi:NIPSNAP family containing protein [Pedobacter sp. HMF7647]|uniref:NIPSNAP family containing protein n=1 Tax=Hufsiella arboris TaxID=2695275 RepID=A0A7K1YE56_9SPHI|nr:NIPSNAP family protein [Hufsiella arboris]MXV52893.1 NIPSNAP family containing protein [Hufsiella arboris]
MKKVRLLLLIKLFLFAGMFAQAQTPAKAYGDYYQLSFYHTQRKSQLDSLSDYIQQKYLPKLHQAGFKDIGVFFPIANDTSSDKQLVLWTPLQSLDQLVKINPGRDAPSYARLETIILTAFEKAPKYKLPRLNGSREEHIFELRSYESPTEERYISKVKMFNAGDEVGLFARLGFNAVFYAHVLAGSRMPNLMYMTSFDNQAAHDEHWKAFGNDSQWKKLSALQEYQKNVNKADIILMHASSYSDVY